MSSTDGRAPAVPGMDRGPVKRSGGDGLGVRDQRVGWVDAGRGLAITLVVLLHAAQWLEAAGFDAQMWQRVNESLVTLRMPLFFSIAGMFAPKWILVSWERLWSDKISLFVWVFILWSFLATGPFILGLIMQGESGNFLAQYQYVLTALWKPRFELWFLWALSLFFIASRLIKRVPPGLQVAMAGGLSMTALSGWSLGNVGWDSSCKYFFFFLVGLHYRDQLFALGRSRHKLALSLICLSWLAMALCGSALELNDRVPGFCFLTALLGVVTGVTVSRVLASSRQLRQIGGRTLPIYLTHTSLILLIAWCIHYLPSSAKEGAVIGGVSIPLVSVLAILTGLFFARVAGSWRLSAYLFEPPDEFRRLLTSRRSGEVRS